MERTLIEVHLHIEFSMNHRANIIHPERHRRVSFDEAFVALLDEHGVAYNERYLWD